MKIWYQHGTEHSANLVMIGHFTDATEAAKVKEIIDELTKQVSADQDKGTIVLGSHSDRYGREMLDLLGRLNIHSDRAAGTRAVPLRRQSQSRGQQGRSSRPRRSTSRRSSRSCSIKVRESRSTRLITIPTPTTGGADERGAAMPALNWDSFTSLPGSAEKNFELLCRGIVRHNFGSYGVLPRPREPAGRRVPSRARQAMRLRLAKPGRWWGWQCKWYELAAERQSRHDPTRRNRGRDPEGGSSCSRPHGLGSVDAPHR